MGILQKLFGSNQLSETSEIEAICPSCRKQLPKAPGKKTKCLFCGEFMYVRTRPSDKKRILVTKEGADKIEEEWSIVSGTHDLFLQNKQAEENTRSELRKRFGKEPSEGDVKWRQLNKDLINNARDENWGFYRNTVLEMGDLLRKELKLQLALLKYLEICYLDVNGPENLGGYDADFRRSKIRFDPKSPVATLAPGIVKYIVQLTKKLNLTMEEIKGKYMMQAIQQQRNLHLEIPPEEAWEMLSEEIKLQTLVKK